jgi:hypothetical protein
MEHGSVGKIPPVGVGGLMRSKNIPFKIPPTPLYERGVRREFAFVASLESHRLMNTFFVVHYIWLIYL